MTKPRRPSPPDLRQIRRALLTAVASDDLLVELLVLKGGNALELIHQLGERASLDLDFSMEGDAEDAGDLESRLRRAAEDRLGSLGLLLDEQELIRQMFSAKEVSLRLLGLISRERERSFHGQAFSAVQQAVRGEVRPFDFYFDFVGSAVKELEPLWEVDAPLG